MNRKNKRGQSTVEYILLVTAVVGVMIIFLTNKNGGFQAQLNATLNKATGGITTEQTLLSSSHAALDATTAKLPPQEDENIYVVNPDKGVGSK